MSQPKAGGKRSCGLPMPPWYILVPIIIILPVWLVYDTGKRKVIEWKDKVKERVKEKREKRKQQRKATEKELLIAAYDSGNTL
jgi:hypothetical protein